MNSNPSQCVYRFLFPIDYVYKMSKKEKKYRNKILINIKYYIKIIFHIYFFCFLLYNLLNYVSTETKKKNAHPAIYSIVTHSLTTTYLLYSMS